MRPPRTVEQPVDHTCQVYCNDPWHLFTTAENFTYCCAPNSHGRSCAGCADPQLDDPLPYAFRASKVA